VTNKPGASDTMGTDALAKSKKDGYTLGYTSSAAMVYSRVTNPETVPYDPVKDFDPLALHTFFPLSVAVQANSPWKTFKELVDYAKKNPGKLRVSTAGVGSTVELRRGDCPVPYRCAIHPCTLQRRRSRCNRPSGSHVEVSFDIVGKFTPHVDAGKLRLAFGKQETFQPSEPSHHYGIRL